MRGSRVFALTSLSGNIFIDADAGERLTPDELEIMIKEADLDGDHEISFAGEVPSLSHPSWFIKLSICVIEFKKVPSTLLPFIIGFY